MIILHRNNLFFFHPKHFFPYYVLLLVMLAYFACTLIFFSLRDAYKMLRFKKGTCTPPSPYISWVQKIILFVIQQNRYRAQKNDDIRRMEEGLQGRTGSCTSWLQKTPWIHEVLRAYVSVQLVSQVGGWECIIYANSWSINLLDVVYRFFFVGPMEDR